MLTEASSYTSFQRVMHQGSALGFRFRFREPGARRRIGMCKDVLGKAVSPRRRVVTQKFLRRKMRHASLTGRASVWQNGVAERPGHSHAHLAEARSSPRRAVDDERGVDERTPRDSDSCSAGHCEDPGQQVAGALPLRLPPGQCHHLP